MYILNEDTRKLLKLYGTQLNEAINQNSIKVNKVIIKLWVLVQQTTQCPLPAWHLWSIYVQYIFANYLPKERTRFLQQNI